VYGIEKAVTASVFEVILCLDRAFCFFFLFGWTGPYLALAFAFAQWSVGIGILILKYFLYGFGVPTADALKELRLGVEVHLLFAL